MTIAKLIIRFQLPACHSLKEKRRRLGGLRQRFGKSASVAVTESALQDCHDRAEWTFIVTGTDRKLVESNCTQIENYLHETIDGFVTDIHREFLQ